MPQTRVYRNRRNGPGIWLLEHAQPAAWLGDAGGVPRRNRDGQKRARIDLAPEEIVQQIRT